MFGNPPVFAQGTTSQLWWPSPLPTTNLDYGLNVGAEVAASSDSIYSVSLAIEPSGAGELQVLDLGVNGEIVVAQLTGGQPGRCYTILITTTGVSGRIWVSTVNLVVNDAGALPPPPAEPPVPGYGTAITWSAGVTMFGPAIASVATNLVATGYTQTTATPLPAATNVISSAPPTSGFILPVGITSGTIVVQNDDPTNTVNIWPPVSAAINDLALNAPYVVGPAGARISFTTNSPSTQWYAG